MEQPAVVVEAEADLHELRRQAVADADHAEGRADQDAEVKAARGGADVEAIEDELLADALDRFVRREVDLREAGDAGENLEAMDVAGEGVGEVFDDLGALGARADEGHFAAGDIGELRELVEVEKAEGAADEGDAGVPLGRPHGLAGGLSVAPHGADFVDLERLAAEAGTLLRVKRLAARGGAHDEREDADNRPCGDEQDQRHEARRPLRSADVERGLYGGRIVC